MNYLLLMHILVAKTYICENNRTILARYILPLKFCPQETQFINCLVTLDSIGLLLLFL